MIFAIYDLEIAKAIPPKNEADRIPGIEYCEGWEDFRNMGISCWALCLFDSISGQISEPIAGTDPAKLLKELNSADIDLGGIPLAGFNSRKFDDKLMAAHGYRCHTDFDILEEILDSAEMKGVEYWNFTPPRSYSLGKIAKANGYEKTLSGELAPIEWQQGNHQKVIDYCKNDVLIEARIMRLFLRGQLLDPNTLKPLSPPLLIC